MPPVHYHFNVPFPGFVDIYMSDMKMRFSEQALKNAITGIQLRKDTFVTEAAYRSVLTIYEQALRLLEEEMK